jgi:hypothetical protein
MVVSLEEVLVSLVDWVIWYGFSRFKLNLFKIKLQRKSRGCLGENDANYF